VYCAKCTDSSRAEKLWLVCGVMGDVMLCDRERDIEAYGKGSELTNSMENILPETLIVTHLVKKFRPFFNSKVHYHIHNSPSIGQYP
jgi:hypothetical protein